MWNYVSSLFQNGQLFYGIFSAIIGGVGLKFVEKILNKKSENQLESDHIRSSLHDQVESLRLDVESQRTQIEELRIEADKWREEYYKQLEANIVNKQLIEELRHEVTSLREEVARYTSSR